MLAAAASSPPTASSAPPRGEGQRELDRTAPPPPPPVIVAEVPPKDADERRDPGRPRQLPGGGELEPGGRRRRQGRRRVRHPAARRRARDRGRERAGDRDERRGLRQAAEGREGIRVQGLRARRPEGADRAGSFRSRASPPCRSAPRSTRARASSSSRPRRSSAKGQRTSLQQGRFGAGMFKIRQAARKRASAAATKPTTDLVLQTPPGPRARVRGRQRGAADQGHRAHARRDRQGRVPHDRRRRHGHGQRRHVDRLRPLRRHADRGRSRQGRRPRHAAQEGLHAALRPGLPGRAELLRDARSEGGRARRRPAPRAGDRLVPSASPVSMSKPCRRAGSTVELDRVAHGDLGARPR